MIIKDKKIFWIFSLSATVYFMQGLSSLPGQALFVYFKKELHMSPSTIMNIGAIVGLAWIVKPIIGFIIDSSGWKRRNWIVLALIIDTIISFYLGIAKLPLILLITILFLSNWNTAFRDVSVDGIMCVEGKKYNLCNKIQSVQWISVTLAGILIGLIGGYIAQINNYKIAFLLLIPIYIMAILISTQYKEELNIKESTKELLSKYKLLWKDKRFIFIALFLFFYAYSPSFGTPLSFIVRDKFHWTEIWIGILGAIESVCGIVGAFFYYKYSKFINIKKWLISSVFIGAITTLAYLHYTPLTAIIYGIIFNVVGMFIFLISMDWIARNSINGLESTSFALLCSVRNFAGNCSEWTGSYLLPITGLNTLIIISSLTSFLCLLFIKKIGLDEKQT